MEGASLKREQGHRPRWDGQGHGLQPRPSSQPSARARLPLGASLSNTVATSHTRLSKLKLNKSKNFVPQPHRPHFKGSVATAAQQLPCHIAQIQNISIVPQSSNSTALEQCFSSQGDLAPKGILGCQPRSSIVIQWAGDRDAAPSLMHKAAPYNKESIQPQVPAAPRQRRPALESLPGPPYLCLQ